MNINSMRDFVSTRKDQDFIWSAEYFDGAECREFEQDGVTENSFNDIDKSKLLRFGLIGNGMSLYYEIDGVFKLAGQSIDIIYKDKDTDKGYYLTGSQHMYNDVIAYKNAESFAAFTENGTINYGSMPSKITQYNFGYKTAFQADDINFNFQAVCKIPFNEPVYMNFWLVADRNINGVLIIKKRGEVVAEIDAPLQIGVGGELNWRVSL